MSKKIDIPEDILNFFKQIDREGIPNKGTSILLNTENLQAMALSSRKELGITQASLGDLAGITLSTVQKIERGDLKVNLQNFLKVMEVLGIEVCLKKK